MSEVLRWWFFLYVFCINCYHQIEMISFIKLFPVIRFFLLQLMLGKVSSFCCLINMTLNLNFYNWSFVDMCWGVCLGRRRVAFHLWPNFFLLLRWLLFVKMFSSCAPSGGKILNQDWCFPCVFHLCWGCVTRFLGGEEGGFPWGLLRLLFTSKIDLIKISFCGFVLKLSAIFIVCWWYSFTKF